MIADLIRNVKEALSSEDVKTALNEVVEPCMKYVDVKVKSVSFFFQVIAILILVQCMATLFLIILEIKRNIH
ncbi:hypothetical protein ATCVNEJV2_552R [Acanthocystis turfacea Chlorella virus NE-JV-2]|nr:hypothetical protein ATCVNEJV2_552R [Acanthocystis turfacea Chlorella virus NE-JV-2]